MIKQERNGFSFLTAPFENCPRNPIGCFVQLVIGELWIRCLDREPVRILPRDFLKSCRNRLLDFFLGELDERPRRMKTLIPDRLLFGRKLKPCSRESLMAISLRSSRAYRQQAVSALRLPA